jgi:hypothetical protein
VKSEVAHKIGHVKLESAEILKSFENLKVVLNTIKQTNIITYNKGGKRWYINSCCQPSVALVTRFLPHYC